MASRYIQKYPIPQSFPLILKNFSREILRDQPANIIQYAAKYFEALEKGQPFKYQSAFNVPKEQKTYELKYEPQKAEDMIRKELRINNITGALSKKQMDKLIKIVDYIYTKYDKNHNGSLEVKELDDMMKQLYKDGYINCLPNDLQKKEFLQRIDQNLNSKIERGELIVFLRGLVV